MKRNLLLIFTIAIGHIFTSCVNENSGNTTSENVKEAQEEISFNPVSINNEYEISVPDYMTPAKDLNAEASLQYQNIYKETYVIIIDESKEDFVTAFREFGEYDDSMSTIENYRKTQLLFLMEGINLKKQTKPKNLTINGLNAEYVELDGIPEGLDLDISYFFTFIEGKNKLYMVMAWTLGDRKMKYKSMFEQLSQSFRLLD